jgi:alpha-D-ribose 1-methylphosphonate 5-triphosphate diphosphatase
MHQMAAALVPHSDTSPCFHIVNSVLVTPERVLEQGSLQVDRGRIVHLQQGAFAGDGPVIDARGSLLIPGFIDLHSDANEKAIEPRPHARFPVAMALQELDKVMAACGVTTIFHCVAFSNGQKGLRATQSARNLIQSIQTYRDHLLCSTRIHLRYDITMREALPVVDHFVENKEVDLVSFMDHTPGQGQFGTFAAFRDYLGRHHQYTEEEVRQVVAKRLADRQAVREDELQALANRCLERQIPLASHDDDTPDKVRQLHQKGVAISEFPVTLEAAREAKSLGMHVAMGAPNLLMGKSTNNNLTAMEAARESLLDVICSDYAPMTLVHAVLKLHQSGLMTLPAAIARLTLHPAHAAGIADETGSLEVGKRADMVLVDVSMPVPRVLKTFVAGRQIYSLT